MQTVSSEAVWAGTVDFDISLKEGEHGYLYIPGTEPETVTINGQEQKSDYWNNNFLDLGTYDMDTVVHVTAETGMQELTGNRTWMRSMKCFLPGRWI